MGERVAVSLSSQSPTGAAAAAAPLAASSRLRGFSREVDVESRAGSIAGFILPVRKKTEVGEKRVYRISRKFFGFVVFLSDKNLEKNIQFIHKTTYIVSKQNMKAMHRNGIRFRFMEGEVVVLVGLNNFSVIK
jgi:hypothetical protein